MFIFFIIFFTIKQYLHGYTFFISTRPSKGIRPLFCNALFFGLTFSASSQVSQQPHYLRWVKKYNANYPATDYVQSVIETFDNGYLVGGNSFTQSEVDKTDTLYNGGPDYWIIKADSSGNQIWDRSFGGNEEEV